MFGDRFVALVAYDPERAASRSPPASTPRDLDALGALAEAWHHDGLATPLVMTPDEFRRSLDTFPLEYQAIIDHHVVIAGAATVRRRRRSTPTICGAPARRRPRRT